MTNELNDLVPAQEKLEWITPKISLMVAEDTAGKVKYSSSESTFRGAPWGPGPS
jgi:hypothetical protein